jgi:hypothetical protein
MKKILQTVAILLLMAGMFSCGKKENNEPPIKLQGTYWSLKGIVDVETGEMKELELDYPEYTGCTMLIFNTDTTANGCADWRASAICLNLSPQQVFVVIENEDDSYTGDLQLFYDTIKTIISYTVTKDELRRELKLYCNEGKNYLFYKEAILY